MKNILKFELLRPPYIEDLEDDEVIDYENII